MSKQSLTEQQENRARTETLRTLIQALTKYESLNGWEYVPPTAEQDNGAYGYGHLVNRELQGAMFLSYVWNDKARIHVSTQFPRDKQGHAHTRYDQAIPSINVSANKTAEQVKNDIVRRLFPEYLPALAAVRDSIAQHDAYLASKASLGQSIKDAFPMLTLRDEINGNDYRGNKINGHDVTLWYSPANGPRVDIKCSEKTAELKIDGLSQAQLTALLTVLLN